MPDDPDIADELAYMAEHPTLFTKAEMAAMMKAAAARLRANKEALAKVRGIMEAISHLDHIPVARVRRRDEPEG